MSTTVLQQVTSRWSCYWISNVWFSWNLCSLQLFLLFNTQRGYLLFLAKLKPTSCALDVFSQAETSSRDKIFFHLLKICAARRVIRCFVATKPATNVIMDRFTGSLSHSTDSFPATRVAAEQFGVLSVHRREIITLRMLFVYVRRFPVMINGKTANYQTEEWKRHFSVVAKRINRDSINKHRPRYFITN